MGITTTRVAILGGGFAACALARRIASMPGVTIDLLEKEPRLGGALQSITIDGALFDTGDSLFELRHPLFAFFPTLDEHFAEVDHRPRIVTAAGDVAATTCASSGSHESVIGRIVRALTAPRRETTSQRRFLRPAAGVEPVSRHIEEDLRVKGVRLRLGAAVASIARLGDELLVTVGSHTLIYDRVISTIPTTALATAIGGEAARISATIDRAARAILFYRLRGAIPDAGTVFDNRSGRGAWRRIDVLSRAYGRVDGEHYFTVECVRGIEESDLLMAAAREVEEHIARLRFVRGRLNLVGGVVTTDQLPLAGRSRMRELEVAIAEQGIDLAGRQRAVRNASSAQVIEATVALALRLGLKSGGVESRVTGRASSNVGSSSFGSHTPYVVPPGSRSSTTGLERGRRLEGGSMGLP